MYKFEIDRHFEHYQLLPGESPHIKRVEGKTLRLKRNDEGELELDEEKPFHEEVQEIKEVLEAPADAVAAHNSGTTSPSGSTSGSSPTGSNSDIDEIFIFLFRFFHRCFPAFFPIWVTCKIGSKMLSPGSVSPGTSIRTEEQAYADGQMYVASLAPPGVGVLPPGSVPPQ